MCFYNKAINKAKVGEFPENFGFWEGKVVD